MRTEEGDELRRIERQLLLGNVTARRPNKLRLRTHERVAVLIADRDRLSCELARIVSGMAEIACRELAAGVAASVDHQAATEAAGLSGDGGDD